MSLNQLWIKRDHPPPTPHQRLDQQHSNVQFSNSGYEGINYTSPVPITSYIIYCYPIYQFLVNNTRKRPKMFVFKKRGLL